MFADVCTLKAETLQLKVHRSKLCHIEICALPKDPITIISCKEVYCLKITHSVEAN